MKHSPPDKTEILLIGCIGLLVCFLIVSAAALTRLIGAKEDEPAPTPSPEGREESLLTPEDLLPDNLSLGKMPAAVSFAEADGSVRSLSSLLKSTASPHGICLLFWASWCPDCERQMQSIREMEALSSQYGFELILIDRLETGRESVEKAQKALFDAGASAKCFYDTDRTCFDAWGLHEIPGTVLLNKEGTVLDYASGELTVGEWEGILRRAGAGRASATLAFLQSSFTGESGQIYTSILGQEERPSPSGRDVLSESEGLMLRYALQCNDRALFDRTLLCVQDLLVSGTLPAWYISEKGEPASASALIDDLRIWSALQDAAKRWGEAYTEQADQMLQNIRSLEMDSRGRFVDFAEIPSGKKSETIALHYLDLAAMQEMAALDPSFAPALQSAEEILQGGLISKQFPLYYSSYNYRTGRYSDADLHTAEALYAFWNLSRVGSLPEECIQWLRQAVQSGNLAARYSVSGEPVPGYSYHSTAVYALSALIAKEIGDDALFELSVRRMERLFIPDAGNILYGAYAQPGAEVYAFDQLMPLLVNSVI